MVNRKRGVCNIPWTPAFFAKTGNEIVAFLLGYFIFICSCNNIPNTQPLATDYSGFVDKKIDLIALDSNLNQKDTLGVLSIKVPSRLDTFYQWRRLTDYTAGGWIQHRFADKKYSQFAESGWIWIIIPDSVYQLTIKYKPLNEIPDSISFRELKEKDIQERWLDQADNLSCSDSITFLNKDFYIINNRSFIISTFHTTCSYVTNKESLFVTAATRLKNRELFLFAECSGKDTSGFITNMYKSIQSTRIKEK